MFDVLIVGAGWAGCVAAERLASIGKRVLILDQRSHIGGNCYDEKNEAGILIHKYGPHLFHTDYEHVWKYLQQWGEWYSYEHKVLANIDGQHVPLPFNLNTIYKLLSSELSKRLETKLISQYGWGAKVPILNLKEAGDEDLKFLADFVYNKVFLNYTLKQWGYKPEDIDPSVTARVPVLVSRDDRYFSDKYQALPKNGYTSVFHKIVDHEKIHLMLQTDWRDVLKLDPSGSIYWMGSLFKGDLVFTGQIDQLLDYQFGHLPYRSLRFEYENFACDKFQDAATVNFPNQHDWTRISEFKHMSQQWEIPSTTIMKEYPQDYIEGDAVKGIPYYPVFQASNAVKYNLYLEESKKWTKLHLIGRLAEYRYYDQDDVIDRVLHWFDGYQKNILNLKLRK
jgi:UDP-galactopyranose mutase